MKRTHEIPIPHGLHAGAAMFNNASDAEPANADPATWSDDQLKRAFAEHDKLLDILRANPSNARNDRRLAECEESLAAITAEGERRGLTGRKTQPEPTPADRRAVARGPIPGAEQWQDEAGNMLAALPPGVSIRAAMRDAPKDAPRAGDVIAAMLTGNWRSDNIKAALSGGSDPDGGFMLTPAVAAEIIDAARAASVAFRAGARTIVMPSPSTRLVRVESDPAMSWRGENQALANSQPVFGALNLNARKLAVLIPVSNELLEDAGNASAEITRLVGEAAAAELDRVILSGDGTAGTPTGIMHASGVQDASGTDSPPEFTWDSVLEGMRLLEAANFADGFSLVLNPALSKKLRGLKDQQLQYLSPPPDAGAIPRYTTTRLGTGEAILGRFAEIIVGVRTQVSIDVSRDFGFDKDQTYLRLRWRGDVGFARAAALAKYEGQE